MTLLNNPLIIIDPFTSSDTGYIIKQPVLFQGEEFQTELPYLFFHCRCLINCDKIASESTRISLTTECTGDPCERAKYHWKLNVVHFGGVEVNDKQLTDKAETNLNSTGIVIKKNQLGELPPGHFYQLKVEVSQQGEPPGYATYQFRINAPPQHGSCGVTPTKGEALKTQFKFECRNWQVRILEIKRNDQNVRGKGVTFQQ